MPAGRGRVPLRAEVRRSDQSTNVPFSNWFLRRTPSRKTWNVSRALCGRCVHLAPQRQRPHIGPHALDVIQTLGFCPALALVFPAKRSVLTGRPDRVLLFV